MTWQDKVLLALAFAALNIADGEPWPAAVCRDIMSPPPPTMVALRWKCISDARELERQRAAATIRVQFRARNLICDGVTHDPLTGREVKVCRSLFDRR